MVSRRKSSDVLASLGLLVCLVGATTLEIKDFASQNTMNEDPVALFLGIKLSDHSYASVKELSLNAVSAVYKETSEEIVKQDLDEINEKAGAKNSWQYSYEPHITNMFVGGRIPQDPEQARLYNQFSEDLKCYVKIPAVAYLPGNLLAGIGFIDLSQILMMNRFPHTTLLNKGMSAKYSNDLLEALDVNEEFRNDYARQFENAKPVTSYGITIEGKTYTAYVWKLPEPLLSTGYTHKFYTA